MNNGIINNLKRKLIKLEEKVNQLNNHKSILINVLEELNRRTNVKLNNVLYDINLQEEISYLNDWIGFYLKDIEKHDANLKRLNQTIGKEASEKTAKENISDAPETKEGVEDSFKLIFREVEEKPKAEIKISEIRAEEKTVKQRIKERISNIRQKLIEGFKAKKLPVKYVFPFIILLLIITSLFLLKPSFTGYVTLGKESAYTENLNLRINESGTYKWVPNKLGEIKSIKASGDVIGNGTVRIYIEKDGIRYLIYKNK